MRCLIEMKCRKEIPEKPLPDGFGKGFAAGVLATLFTGAMFFAGWNAGQYMNDPADVSGAGDSKTGLRSSPMLRRYRSWMR